MDRKRITDGAALVEEARAMWQAGGRYREDRRRNKRYTYGRQWDDMVEYDGRMMTEEAYIREQGSVPLKNNLIRRLVRSVLGVFRARMRMPAILADELADESRASLLEKRLRASCRRNRMSELYARSMEEFLIGGFVAHRKWYGIHEGAAGCRTDYVDPESFFMDTGARDFRGWDISAIGQLHDLSADRLRSAFAHSPEMAARLEKSYGDVSGAGMWGGSWGLDSDIMRAFHSSPGGRFRVIEMWRREQREYWLCHDRTTGTLSSSSARPIDSPDAEWRSDTVWRYYFLTPWGEVLAEGDSPYGEAGHPYVVKAYPYIDGEIHSFVADIIDQQRYTNRLITLYDWIMRSSAKGVLLFPEEGLPAGMDIADVCDQWGRFNGVITYRSRPGVALPQQVSSNATNIGIAELLNIQLKMLEDVAGVNGALQGRLDNGKMSGTLFNQQTQNSLTSLRDILDSFDAFILDGMTRDAANLCLFENLGPFGYEIRLTSEADR